MWFPTSVANCGKPFPRIDGLRFACYETPSLTYSCMCPHLPSVSRRWLKHRIVRRVVGIAQILRIILPRTQEVVRHQIRRSRLRHHQIHRSRLRHRRTFCGSIFLPSLWHGTLLSVWKKEMAARDHREIHDIQQTKKIVPLITCEITFAQNVSELVLGVNIFDLDLGSKLILSNNKSSATLRVLDTCLIVTLLPLMIILITASLSSRMYNWGLAVRRICVCGDVVHMRQFLKISDSLLFGFGFCDFANSFLSLQMLG